MANTLTGLIPTIYEALDVVQREQIGIITAVNRDSGIERAAKGQTITAFVAPPVTASDIVPAVTPPNDGDQVFGSFNVTIDNAKRVPIRWNGEEQRGLNTNGVGANRMLVDQWAQGMRALSNAIEIDTLTKAIRGASRAYGTPGSTPFGTPGDFTDFSNPAQILDDNGAPLTDRHMILSSSSVNNLRGRQNLLFKQNEAGTDRLLRQGIIDRVEGFDIHQSAAPRPVVKGTGSGYLTNAASLPVGTTSIPVDTGTGTILAGDVISIAGDPSKYAVTGTLAGGFVTIGTPGLRFAAADNSAITVENTYTPNVAMSRGGMILATRAPALPVDMNGTPSDMAEDREYVTDPVSGIVYEISVYKQYRQIQYEIALAWGANVVKQDFIAILRG